jgi:tetratricopeptide (TPR) repeat protein
MLNKININPQRQLLIVYIVLTVVTLAVFWQVNQFDFINFDDDIYVTQNSNLLSGITLDGLRWAFSTTYAEFWHPLTWISLMFDYQLHGMNAGGYHLTNLILHIISTLLLFWLFNRMTGAIWRSAFIAALFALHPLRVESVAWVSERKDVLSAFFWMLTLCLYVYYTEKPVIRRYLLILLSFACGLMSKSMVVTLPIVMILLDYWPLGRLQSQKIGPNLMTNIMPISSKQGKQKNKSKKGALKKDISPPNNRKLSETKIAGIIPLWQLREKIPFFIFSATFSIITLYAQYNMYVKHPLHPLGFRIANAPVFFVTYLEKIFWPHDLALGYPSLDQISVWQVLGAALLILFISAAVIASVKRLPYLFVGLLWYAITILPVIGIIPVGDPMADRYIYLPSIGITIMLVWGVPSLIKSEEICKKILVPTGIAALAILAVLTWQQCGYWKNSITIFTHTLQVTKNNFFAHNQRGADYDKLGQYQLAIEDYNEAIRLKPDLAETYNRRGNVYDKLGQYQLSIKDYNEAIRLKPDLVGAYNNRGNVYDKLGQYQLAIEDYKEAIRLKPDLVGAFNNRGNAYTKLGQYQLAIEDYKEAIRLKPDLALGYNNRGNVYNKLGQYQFAIEDYNEAIRLKPDLAMAYNNRGLAYLAQGNKKLGCFNAQMSCAMGVCKTLELAKSNGYCL